MKFAHVVLCMLILLITSNIDEIKASPAKDSVSFFLKAEKENIAAQYEKIMQMKLTEDAENDFAIMMINYNSAVKFLLENEIEKGRDSIMTFLARQTLRRQIEVEGILNTYVGKIKLAKSKIDKNSEVVGSSGEKKLPDLMMGIVSKVRSLALSGNQDFDFALMLGYHCSGALNIIDDYLNKADDKVLEIVAKRLKEENQLSVELIEKWKSRITK